MTRGNLIQLTLTLKMTTALVVETSVTVNNNSPIQDYVHPDDHSQLTYQITPGFQPLTKKPLFNWSMQSIRLKRNKIHTSSIFRCGARTRISAQRKLSSVANSPNTKSSNKQQSYVTFYLCFIENH